jgi:hypothetical protein
MKINLGKSLSRKEMKSILGGATASCTPQGGNPVYYAAPCCSGLSPCRISATSGAICEPIHTPCYQDAV